MSHEEEENKKPRVDEAIVELTDAHAHLQDKRLGETQDAIATYLSRARERGVVRVVCSATSPADWNAVAKIARENAGVVPTFGVHPWYCGKISGDWLATLARILEVFLCRDGATRAGIGEVGLDFAVRDCDDELKSRQEAIFRAQLELANLRKLPVVVHSVRANSRALAIMGEYKNVPAWLLHGWRGTRSEVERAAELGAFFSFSSRQTTSRSELARETIVAAPRDRILLESDSPNPVPPNGYGGRAPSWQGKLVQARDERGFIIPEPASVVDVVAELAGIRKTRPEELARQIAVNERRFFASWQKKAD